MNSMHAQQRLAERLTSDEIARIWPRIEDAKVRAARANVAFRSESMDFHGQSWGEDSNGDTLVVVIRFGTLVTLMWRRKTQPFAPYKFRVDAVEEL